MCLRFWGCWTRSGAQLGLTRVCNRRDRRKEVKRWPMRNLDWNAGTSNCRQDEDSLTRFNLCKSNPEIVLHEHGKDKTIIRATRGYWKLLSIDSRSTLQGSEPHLWPRNVFWNPVKAKGPSVAFAMSSAVQTKNRNKEDDHPRLRWYAPSTAII